MGKWIKDIYKVSKILQSSLKLTIYKSMGNKKVGNISVDDLEMSTVFFKITKYITYLQRNSKRIE